MASAALRPETSAPSTHCTRSSQQASPAKRSRPPHSAEASTPHMSLPACPHATPQSSSEEAAERLIGQGTEAGPIEDRMMGMIRPPGSAVRHRCLRLRMS